MDAQALCDGNKRPLTKMKGFLSLLRFINKTLRRIGKANNNIHFIFRLTGKPSSIRANLLVLHQTLQKSLFKD